MAKKSKRGRPSVNAKLILVRLRPEELRKLDADRRQHGAGQSRPAAIRRIVAALP